MCVQVDLFTFVPDPTGVETAEEKLFADLCTLVVSEGMSVWEMKCKAAEALKEKGLAWPIERCVCVCVCVSVGARKNLLGGEVSKWQ